MKRIFLSALFTLLIAQIALANVYYVSTSGNDTSGDGSAAKPWKTLKYAVTKVAANQGHSIQLSAGTFVETGMVGIPTGVSLTGAGIDQTILKAASSFYYNPAAPSYAADKFLISLNSSSQVSGNQTIKGFTIEGDSKHLHGGIYVYNRSNVTIDAVKVQNTNFTGIWLWEVKNSTLKNSQLVNCSWGSASYCSGALNLGNLEGVEINQINIDESTGYGIKAIGPGGNNNIINVKIHDSHISVNPTGLWNSGSAPNIAIELWSVNLVGNELYNNYVDNTISLVNSNQIPSTGVQTIRVHHNTIDMDARAHGAGYPIELTVHDAEIDHNYFNKGTYGIANWDHPMTNWNIHHNTFYALQGQYPGEVVRSQSTGLHNVKVYNNTVEFASNKTMNVIGLYGGASENVDIQNNLFIDNNSGYSYYPNQLVHLENNAALTGLIVKKNLFSKLPVGSVPGTYLSNLSGDPMIQASGLRPDPYYAPKAGSPLIDAGLNLGYTFLGLSADIGALEYVSSTNALPVVSMTSPVNNASYAAGAPVTITTTASDTDGTISKVEFYNGSTLLGQDLTSPYSFVWSNAPAGSHVLTAKATDNKNGVTTSAQTSIVVTSGNVPPVATVTSPLANANFVTGSSITIQSTATDAGGSISKVQFYNGTTLLGQDLYSPYSFVWSNVPAGNYSITIKATDNQNAVTTSAAVAIHVINNVAPVVTLTGPANNSNITAGASLIITANATDANGIRNVQFYNGSTLLNQDVAAPYSFTWANLSPGTYLITAKATDNKGASTATAPVTVTVAANDNEAVLLGFDSSDATLSGQMTAGSDPAAGMGSYFSVPSGNGKNYYIPSPACATFNFNVPKTGNYVVWAKIKSPTSQNQGHYVYSNGKWLTWLGGVHNDWTWVKITDNGADAKFAWSQGMTEFKMGWFDENAQVDQILATDDPGYSPSQSAAASSFSLFPNPVVTENLTMQYTSPTAQQAQVSIFDYGSTLIKQTTVNLAAGSNDIVVDTQNVYNGSYIVSFQTAKGEKSTARFIISR